MEERNSSSCDEWSQTVIVEIDMIQNNRIEIHFILDWRNWIRPRPTTGKVSKKTKWPTCTWRGMYVAFFWTNLLLVFNLIFSVIWHLRNIIYKSLFLQHVIQCSYKPNQGLSVQVGKTWLLTTCPATLTWVHVDYYHQYRAVSRQLPMSMFSSLQVSDFSSPNKFDSRNIAYK